MENAFTRPAANHLPGAVESRDIAYTGVRDFNDFNDRLYFDDNNY
jgi:hypothetical protein